MSAPPGQGAAHFAWQTGGAYVAAREKTLVELAFLPLGRRILDVGCGHGATLEHLGRPAGAIGIDLDPEKIAFARENVPGCSFVVGSALHLPMQTGAFDQVIVRDVLHHLEDPAAALEECARVLEPGGRLDVLEPCRNNPLIFMHGLMLKEERGELRSTMAYLQDLVGRRFDVAETHHHQALPLHRLVFHPDLGWPEASQAFFPRRAVDRLERIAARVMPRWAWAYLHVRAYRRAT